MSESLSQPNLEGTQTDNQISNNQKPPINNSDPMETNSTNNEVQNAPVSAVSEKETPIQSEGREPQTQHEELVAPREIIRPSVTILEWEAPERMFKQYPREFYRRIAVMLLFFALILIIIKEFLLILVLGVVFFAIYAFHTIPPRRVVHRITTNGVDFASGHLYKWNELDSFFIENKEGVDILNINTVEALPGRLFLLIDKKIDLANLSEVMNERISIVENPQKGVLDNMMSGFSSRIKFDQTSS